MKRLAILILTLAAAMTTACGASDNGGSSQETSESLKLTSDGTTLPDSDPVPETTSPTATTAKPEEPIKDITTAKELEILPQVAEYVEFDLSVEAQEGEYPENITEADELEGASDNSYLTGFSSAEDKWEFRTELPASQYYNVVLVIVSDEGAQCENSLLINGEEWGSFSTDGSGKFEAVGFDNIFLEQGENSFGIGVKDGGISFDYMMISASDTVATLDLSYKERPQLSNKNAGLKTRAVYAYLADVYGKNIISGQYQTVSTNAEAEAIYELTGHYPAIRFGDLISYTEEDTYADDIDKALEWAKSGGLVGYVWHWQDPMGGAGYYSQSFDGAPDELKTSFDLSKAVTDIDIALIPTEDLETMCKEGGISAECLAIIKDIDIVARQLGNLQSAGVTVLWRPLHEAGGSWFWWGNNVESYQWLWKLMYTRMTEYYELNNLIWIWNGQNPDWYVGDDYCDIISADIYDKAGDSQLSAFLSLRRICPQKMLALSECGRAPEIQLLANEKIMWSFFGIWSGGYVIDEYGKYSEEIIPKQEMTDLYSNSIVICRDELPDFDKLAEELESAGNQPEAADSSETDENADSRAEGE